MTGRTPSLALAFLAAALLVRGDPAGGASVPVPARATALRHSALRLVSMRLRADIDQRLADAADGGAGPLDAEEAAALDSQLSRAEALRAGLGAEATLEEDNTVRSLAARLRLLKDDEPAAPIGPGFGPAAGIGVITGTVWNANTSAPLAGATVYIFDCASRFLLSATTNASGVYTTTATLETGTHYAYASRPGYITEVYSDVVPAPALDVATGTPIAVTSGATTSNVNFALAPGGQISGTVTNAVTAAGVTTAVFLYDASGTFAAAGYSNAAGAYTTTEGVRTGTYYAYAAPAAGLLGELYNNLACPFVGHGCAPTSGTPIAVTAGAVHSGINFTLSPGGRIGGKVTASSGGAGLDGYVYVYDSSVSDIVDFPQASAAAGGAYLTDPGLPSGNYFVVAGQFADAYLSELYNNILCEPTCAVGSGTPVAVTAGMTTPNVNFALGTAGGISGTVIDGATSAPVQGVAVFASDANGATFRAGVTNGSGLYSLAGLPSGSYYVRAYPSGAYVAMQYNNVPCTPCGPTAGTAVPVIAPAFTPGIDFTLAPAGSMSGLVTNAVSGAGVGGISVSAYSGGTSTGRAATTTCSGGYTITGLPTGSYRALSWPFGTYADRYRSEVYDNLDCGTGTTCSVASGAAIPVTASADTPGVDFNLIRYRTVADFDRDRKTDIGVYDPASGLWFVRNQFTQGYGGPGATIVPGDYDGDLKTDMAVYYEASGLWYVRRTTTGTDLVQGFGGPGYKPVPGDYDGDGKTDFAVFHDASGLWFVKQSSNGATVSFPFGSSGATLVPADYDRDGKTDAAVFYEASGLWYIRQSSSLITFSTGYGGTGYKPVRGDFDGDGRSDIAVYHNASAIWFIRNWGTGATTSVAFGGAGYIPVPGDYNGDAKTDLAVYDPASYLWFYRSVSGGGTTTVGFGGAGYIPIVIK